MSFPLPSLGSCIPSRLPDLDGLLVLDTPKTYALLSGDAAPVQREGPLTPAEGRSLLAAAIEELSRVETHVLTQRSSLYSPLNLRFQRYQLLKHSIAVELSKQPFDFMCVKNTHRGLFQFDTATWALRQLLASEDDAQLVELFKETSNWIRVGRFLASTLPVEQQARDYGETFDALLCRLERASTRDECLDRLAEIRSRLGESAHALCADPSLGDARSGHGGVGQARAVHPHPGLAGLSDPHLAQPRRDVPGPAPSTSAQPWMTTHGWPPSHQRFLSRKRPSPDTSAGPGDAHPAGSLAGSPSKRSVIARHDPVPGHGSSSQAGPSWSCQ